MAKQFEQLKRMRGKADRLKEKAIQAGNSRMADKHLRQADNILASVQAIKDNWKEFGERAQGNVNFKGMRHTREVREKMSSARKDFWKSKAGFDKMWQARRARQFREKGKCLLRFPRLGVSVEQEWLAAYRKRYHKITGKRLGRSDVHLYHEGD
jgi:hypothetical protein